ncbi:YybH family protein [Nibricoccus sp. IMCC34717]|uniref:YybH family protein n=1 Tax=Nibricoccus sp. IMCC34717 TaxID=3034021 RepID=UPI0038509602
MKGLHIVLAVFCLFISESVMFGQEITRKDGTRSAEDDVRSTEMAFAKSMADRDFESFASYVASDTLFFGAKGPLRGKTEVLSEWRSLFVESKAPFSWKPLTVEVLKSGDLAISTGPVFDSAGNHIRTFVSIWKLEADGKWRIVFDKGGPPESRN